VAAEDPTPSDADEYVYVMRHARHDRGALDADAIRRVRGAATRLREWLEVHPSIVEVAYSKDPEVLSTVTSLVDTAMRDGRASGDSRSGPPATFRLATTDEQPPHTAPDIGNWSGWRVSRKSGTKGEKGWLPPPAADDGKSRCWPVPSFGPQTKDHDSGLSAYEPLETILGPIRTWLRGPRDPAGATSRLFVGNDPIVSRLTADLTGRSIALAHSELACLQRRSPSWIRKAVGKIIPSVEEYPRYQLVWTAAPYDDEEVDGIVGKIKSKMTTAASLGTVITGLLVFLLESGSETRSWWSWASLMLFVGAAALYFVTMFFYDSLSLPPRFWAPGKSAGHRAKHRWLLRPLRRFRRGRRRLLRPPSSTARVLAETMMHTWSWLFLPATVFTGLGVAMLVADMAFGSTREAMIESEHVVGALLYLLALGLYSAAHRPNLGASD
jgi:hypothetical protein